MSSNIEIGPLGLPKQFTEDPLVKVEQSWQAVETGFNFLNRKIRKNASLRKWRPNRQNPHIVNTTAEFVAFLTQFTPDQQEYLNEHGDKVGSVAIPEIPGVLINTEVVNTPLFVAVATAHEALHLNTSNPLVKALKGGQVACLATETFIEYCSLEALGLLRKDPSTLNNPALEEVIDRAQRFHNVLSSAFGNQAENFAWAVTFGRICDPQIRAVDKTFGTFFDASLKSFYSDGIIPVAAGINAPQLYGSEDIAAEHYSTVIDWSNQRATNLNFSTVWKR